MQPLSMSSESCSERLTCYPRLRLSRQRVQLAVEPNVKPLIQLDFEDLEMFEPVTDQYKHLGVIFADAIALTPSNPTFQPRHGHKVLIPQTQDKAIILSFTGPVERVGAYVSGAKPVAVTAFGADNQVLGQTCTFTGYPTESNQVLPIQRLKIEGTGITKIIFHSEAPFVLDDLFFVGMLTEA